MDSGTCRNNGEEMDELDDLEKRLAQARARHEDQKPKDQAASGREMATGIRAFMEMIGVLLGSGIMGYALDAFLGTSPILLIIFVILGIVAAIFNLYKLSRNLGTAIGSNSLQSDDKIGRKSPENESGNGVT